MSELVRESRQAAGATELLSVARFLDELRHVTRFRSSSPIGDPLDAAVRRIENNPAFSLSRILTRLLTALTYERGDLRAPEFAPLIGQRRSPRSTRKRSPWPSP